MKSFLKKIIPGRVINYYHYLIAIMGAVYYGFPSRKLIIIGITGTKGKTSAANFLWSALNSNGEKAGIIGTANIRIGEEEYLNHYHMTMPGKFIIQSWLKRMVKAGVRYAVVETTSEGIKQLRHKGIDYDILIFTNLTPEHLPSHGGSFEKYKEAKGKLFKELLSTKRKIIDGKKVPKAIVINYDSPHKDYFLSFKADQKLTYGLKEWADIKAVNIENSPEGAEFEILGEKYHLSIPGGFNVYNAMPSIAIGKILGISQERIKAGLAKISLIPGRMERINEGQDFSLFVDYAHEKESMTAVLDTAKSMHPNKIIVLLGAEGGGRDKSKRPIMGSLAGEKADYVIVSNVDPYEDEPMPIIEDIAVASEAVGKIRGKDLFVIEDRRAGIKKALELATQEDVVLITGKGAEQSIIINGKSSPWDDRVVVKEELRKLLHK